MKYMKRYVLFSLLLISFFSVIPFFSYATTVSPFFGGQVVMQQPCNNGLLLYVKTLIGIKPLLWTAGELPFLMHVAPHVGQYMIGMSAIATVPCTLGPVVVGAGYPIIYHGESL